MDTVQDAEPAWPENAGSPGAAGRPAPPSSAAVASPVVKDGGDEDTAGDDVVYRSRYASAAGEDEAGDDIALSLGARYDPVYGKSGGAASHTAAPVADSLVATMPVAGESSSSGGPPATNGSSQKAVAADAQGPAVSSRDTVHVSLSELDGADDDVDDDEDVDLAAVALLTRSASVAAASAAAGAAATAARTAALSEKFNSGLSEQAVDVALRQQQQEPEEAAVPAAAVLMPAAAPELPAAAVSTSYLQPPSGASRQAEAEDDEDAGGVGRRQLPPAAGLGRLGSLLPPTYSSLLFDDMGGSGELGQVLGASPSAAVGAAAGRLLQGLPDEAEALAAGLLENYRVAAAAGLVSPSLASMLGMDGLGGGAVPAAAAADMASNTLRAAPPEDEQQQSLAHVASAGGRGDGAAPGGAGAAAASAFGGAAAALAAAAVGGAAGAVSRATAAAAQQPPPLTRGAPPGYAQQSAAADAQLAGTPRPLGTTQVSHRLKGQVRNGRRGAGMLLSPRCSIKPGMPLCAHVSWP